MDRPALRALLADIDDGKADPDVKKTCASSYHQAGHHRVSLHIDHAQR